MPAYMIVHDLRGSRGRSLAKAIRQRFHWVCPSDGAFVVHAEMTAKDVVMLLSDVVRDSDNVVAAELGHSWYGSAPAEIVPWLNAWTRKGELPDQMICSRVATHDPATPAQEMAVAFET
jgi:hypothetical protein